MSLPEMRVSASTTAKMVATLNAGTGKVDWLDDGWTVVSRDRKPSAHFEHTVLITDGDPELLIWRPRTALPEQLGVSL